MPNMGKRITIIQGHPDPAGSHLCNALADAYAEAALGNGHAVRRVEVAGLDFAILRTQRDFETGKPGPDIRSAQDAVKWADHLLFVYPVWLGTVPALLKAFLEQLLRPDFAFSHGKTGTPAKHLKGRSARIISTMGMPVLAYRWYFGGHGLKNLEKAILKFCGIGPIRETLFGMVGQADAQKRRKWLEKVADQGRAGI